VTEPRATEFSQAERQDPVRAAKRLLLASQDMREAHEAAEWLIERPSARILETALAVSYARPWTSAAIGELEDHWLPTADLDRSLHSDLLRLRNKLYAHTDDDLGARGVRDVSGMIGSKGITLVNEWRHLKAELLPVMSQLATSQQARFRSAVNELSELIEWFAVELRWSPALGAPARGTLLDELQSEFFALNPTRRHTADVGLAVEINLIIPAGSDERFAYGVRRLLRALRQWDRRLVPNAIAYVALEPLRYTIPVGGSNHGHVDLNDELLLADWRKADHLRGNRGWDFAQSRWVADDSQDA
jgi:hypothetical protein